MKIIFLALAILALPVFGIPGTPESGHRLGAHPAVKAFGNGESIRYGLYYTLAGIYVNAGTAMFTTRLTQLQNRAVYHLKGEGTSNSHYDWIFKVRDEYESYVDTSELQPLQFIRHVQEGKYKKFEQVSFNRSAGTAITSEGVYKVPSGVHDVISIVYAMRNIDFNRYKANDTISFNLFLDNQVYELYVRYICRETVRTKYGKFNAIKIKPLLIKGTLFQGGEQMDIWITDDENHIPVRIQTPLVVGKLRADMMQFDNLSYPLSALIKGN